MAPKRCRCVSARPCRFGPLVGSGSGLAWLDDTTVGVLSTESGGPLFTEQLVGGPATATDAPQGAASVAGATSICDGATAHGRRLALREARRELAADDERHPDPGDAAGIAPVGSGAGGVGAPPQVDHSVACAQIRGRLSDVVGGRLTMEPWMTRRGWAPTVRAAFAEALALVLPVTCAGCDEPDVALCEHVR